MAEPTDEQNPTDRWMAGDDLDEWTKRVQARKQSTTFKKRRHKKRKRRTDEYWL